MSTGERRALSVLVCARNEEGVLGACLASAGFADEIVVVDSGSADGTMEIARASGATVLEHGFESHAAQKNWGLSQVANDWVLVLDADEIVPPELAREIGAVLSERDPRPGYWIRRRNRFLGRWIRGAGWARDRVLRLFDRRVGRYAERRVHEEVALSSGHAGTLENALEHDSCRDLGTWIGKTVHYASLGAEEAWSNGRRARPLDLAVRPTARFVKQWLFQGGFRDGVEGWILCTVSAFGVFVKYAKLLERGRSARTGRA